MDAGVHGHELPDDIPQETQQVAAQFALQACIHRHDNGAHVAGMHVLYHIGVVLLPHLDLGGHQIRHHLLLATR